MQAIAGFLHEIGQLKRTPRSGWQLAGVDRPESVAEHSHRTSVIAWVLAALEGADPARASLLALFHDTAEARTGDSHRLAQSYLVDHRQRDERARHDQVRALPAVLAEALRALWADYEARDSREARIAKDADRLECLIQAREYAETGHPTDEWIESALAELETRAARDLAAAILSGKPSDWRRGHSSTAEA
jgi:putative hydrolase of HD superfamily